MKLRQLLFNEAADIDNNKEAQEKFDKEDRLKTQYFL